MQPQEGAATLFSGVRETCQNSSRLWSLRQEVTTYTKPVVSIKLVSIHRIFGGTAVFGFKRKMLTSLN